LKTSQSLLYSKNSVEQAAQTAAQERRFKKKEVSLYCFYYE